MATSRSAPTLPVARLDDVRPEDLRDASRTLQLHGQAVARGLADPSESGRLRFVALAEHAAAVGKANPGGLFAALLRRGAWSFITQAEEDRARCRLHEHLHGRPGGTPVVPMTKPWTAKESGLSTDARMVREVRSVVIRAGIYRDPWPEFQVKSGWEQSRWDAAMRELGLNSV